MKHQRWFTLLAWLSIAVWSVRLTVAQEVSREDLRFFEQKVRPLLVEHCYECHSSQSKQLKGGLRLDDPLGLERGGDSGPLIHRDSLDESLLVKAIRYDDTGLEMPPSGKLGKREIATLEQWVARGLPSPRTNESAPRPEERKSIDIEEGKKHWAFQPLGTALPVADRMPGSWAHNIIDDYIQEKQKENGLVHAKPASREKLLRRTKIDLLGLPPSAQEVKEFIEDVEPDAFEQRVDKWLASPRYGERWGRFWLELARYCDVAESWAETRGNSYLYRDWVVSAFNQDLPFDRFAMLQLAADQIPETPADNLTALGFLGLSPSYWKELQLPVEIIKSIVSDEYEERVHTLTSTFLGLNVACARCHDHKFDPITVQDYYALSGVFANTRIVDRALTEGVDSIKVFEAHKRVKELEAEIKKGEAELKKLETELEKLAVAQPPKDQSTQAPSSQAENQAVAGKNSEVARKNETEKKADEQREKIAKLKEKILEAESINGFACTMSPGVLDAKLEVKAAEGTHGSRIVYEENLKDLAIEIRGNPNNLGAHVPRRYIAVLTQGRPKNFSHGSGRLELAQSLFSESTPLVARVMVNRLWKQHFGIGLVETPSDFGKQGERPTHPEMLDSLATHFVESGWSLKDLHRQILLSATYQQSSGPSDSDPGKRYYSTYPLRKLDVEVWRDAMLVASDTMDFSMGGPPTELSQNNHSRRTIYGTVRRRELTDLLRLYDFPDPLTHSPNRAPTTTPLQQLYYLNSPFIQEQASALSARLHREALDDEARVALAYQLLFGREPTSHELALGLHFVHEQSSEQWPLYCQVLLGSNEFYFVD